MLRHAAKADFSILKKSQGQESTGKSYDSVWLYDVWGNVDG